MTRKGSARRQSRLRVWVPGSARLCPRASLPQPVRAEWDSPGLWLSPLGRRGQRLRKVSPLRPETQHPSLACVTEEREETPRGRKPQGSSQTEWNYYSGKEEFIWRQGSWPPHPALELDEFRMTAAAGTVMPLLPDGAAGHWVVSESQPSYSSPNHFSIVRRNERYAQSFLRNILSDSCEQCGS